MEGTVEAMPGQASLPKVSGLARTGPDPVLYTSAIGRTMLYTNNFVLCFVPAIQVAILVESVLKMLKAKVSVWSESCDATVVRQGTICCIYFDGDNASSTLHTFCLRHLLSGLHNTL